MRRAGSNNSGGMSSMLVRRLGVAVLACVVLVVLVMFAAQLAQRSPATAYVHVRLLCSVCDELELTEVIRAPAGLLHPPLLLLLPLLLELVLRQAAHWLRGCRVMKCSAAWMLL